MLFLAKYRAFFSLFFLVFFFLPLLASAQGTLAGYVFIYVGFVLRPLYSLLIGLAVVIFIWGVIRYVIASGDEKKIDEAKKYMLWGIIGIFVMVSVWGIVKIIIQFFFGSPVWLWLPPQPISDPGGLIP